GGGVPAGRHRADNVAAACGLMAGLRLHWRAVAFAGGTFWNGTWRRRARARRVFRHRVGEPESARLRRRSVFVRRVSTRAGHRELRWTRSRVVLTECFLGLPSIHAGPHNEPPVWGQLPG